jgi:hypothetical protein
VGEIEKIHYLDVEESGEVAGVNLVIGVLNSIANTEEITLSPEGLVDGLNRVFPFDTMHRRMAQQTVNMASRLVNDKKESMNSNTELRNN